MFVTYIQTALKSLAMSQEQKRACDVDTLLGEDRVFNPYAIACLVIDEHNTLPTKHSRTAMDLQRSFLDSLVEWMATPGSRVRRFILGRTQMGVNVGEYVAVHLRHGTCIDNVVLGRLVIKYERLAAAATQMFAKRIDVGRSITVPPCAPVSAEAKRLARTIGERCNFQTLCFVSKGARRRKRGVPETKHGEEDTTAFAMLILQSRIAAHKAVRLHLVGITAREDECFARFVEAQTPTRQGDYLLRGVEVSADCPVHKLRAATKALEIELTMYGAE